MAPSSVVSGNAAGSAGSIGSLLQYWRKARHLSQLALANEADVSSRHVCFLETGRAKPSREMVLLLAEVLDVPLRERNHLLLAAGFAPMYSETSLQAPELAPVRGALDAILRQQEPYPAVVLNRCWDILQMNGAAGRFFSYLSAPRSLSGPANVLRLMFDPQGLRPYVANWDTVATALLQRAHRECVGGMPGAELSRILDEITRFPAVPARPRQPDLEQPLIPVIPVCFEKDGLRFDFFSTVTTLGTPLDITVQEVRIECFFPANPETERHALSLAQ